MTALDGPHLARAHPLESAGHRSRATGPERARAAAGFDHFCLGALDKSAIDFLAERLTAERRLGFGDLDMGDPRLSRCRHGGCHADRDTVAESTTVVAGAAATLEPARVSAKKCPAVNTVGSENALLHRRPFSPSQE